MRAECKLYRMNSHFSEKINYCLQGKASEFNEKYSSNITLDQLVRVYKRGEKTSSVFFSPSKSVAQWAMARVNMFLRLISDRHVSDSYRFQDLDISEGTDQTYEQGTAEPFWKFSDLDFTMARSDLLLAHITDEEAENMFFPPSVEED